MTIVIAGGSGFLGGKLATRLVGEGHRVVILTRRDGGEAGFVSWRPDGSPGALPKHLNGADVVVNLAGERLPGKRWSKARKEALRSSRILSTRTLVTAITECKQPPRVFVSGSAIGYYGPHGDEPVTEVTPPGSDFLARLCVEWEQEAQAVVSPATRLAIVRTGLVLAKEGGALEAMLRPFRFGLGAKFGSGNQYIPWIHSDDWTAMVIWLMKNDRAAGAFNATAPTPVTNRTFTRTLGRVLRRPAILQAPAFVLRAVLGEMSDMLLTGQRVLPAYAEQLGFRFTYRTLEPALASLELR